MMKFYFLLFFSLILSCQASIADKQNGNDFSAISKEIKFKYFRFGEGRSPQTGEYVKMSILVTDTLSDSLYYVGDYPHFFQIKNDQLSIALKDRSIGDSAAFQIKRKLLDNFYDFGHGLQRDVEELRFYFSLKEIYSSSEYPLAKAEVLFHQRLKEQKQLDDFLKKHSKKVDSINGVYRIIEKHNPEGRLIQHGSTVYLDYIGRLMGGYVFENTFKKAYHPVFKYGKDFQLIEGVQDGLEGIKSGEKVKIILPSQHAFGEEGSVAGIVPPFTAVIFEVTIKKVKN